MIIRQYFGFVLLIVTVMKNSVESNGDTHVRNILRYQTRRKSSKFLKDLNVNERTKLPLAYYDEGSRTIWERIDQGENDQQRVERGRTTVTWERRTPEKTLPEVGEDGVDGVQERTAESTTQRTEEVDDRRALQTTTGRPIKKGAKRTFFGGTEVVGGSYEDSLKDQLEGLAEARPNDLLEMIDSMKPFFEKHMTKMLIAYKIKFFLLIPVLIGGFLVIIGSTSLAGLFFAMFVVGLWAKNG